ncbi:lysine N(6)-hydroxylase/L-ornithine N(5)-oxygenase family protein [Jatrophihabitans sp.]|uniref:lysine N(6)-hydroxylase/L-ornithine N(5)-oxygenase family protein n=1 Tax=Jatrophihabitans sp. TaxID=1932789 RepID=UPI002C1D07A5|nr:SidA/IucD/PvdA family monooxygenase [Jatrophihabitans sp.]
MDRQEVEVLAIGAGPANLSLAVALEELAPEVARETVIVEQHDTVVWQRGLLLPWSQSQVSFLKDLVTRRNPRSRYSFVNFLHETDRLDDFINLGSFTPYRMEISDYLSWVARNLSEVRIQSGRRCVSIEPCHDADGEVSEWLVRLADGGEIACRNLIIGAGRDPHIPAEFAQVPRERLIHSTEFSSRIAAFDRDAEHRIVVLGGAQSAAEMLWASHQEFPNAQCTMVMRSIGLNCYENSKFTNQLYFPSFVDEFHAALPEARDQLLREMHRTNYSGLNPALLDVLYRQMYLEKLTGADRLKMITMSEVAAARMADNEVVLTLLDRKNGGSEELRCDLVLLGTGFEREMPKVIRDLAASVSMDEVSVSRSYRMNLPPNVRAGCYLQGVNEATHGIADSLLSLLAVRSEEIVRDLLSHQPAHQLVATVPVPS